MHTIRYLNCLNNLADYKRYHPSDSKDSIRDADVLVISPFALLPKLAGLFAGIDETPVELNKQQTWLLLEYHEFWNEQIEDALSMGRTVIYYIENITTFYKTLFNSRTQTTYHVRTTSCSLFPGLESIDFTECNGSNVKCPSSPILATLNETYSQYMFHSIVFKNDFPIAYSTADGARRVGFLNRHSNGHVLVLPPIEFERLLSDQYNCLSSDVQMSYDEFVKHKFKDFENELITVHSALTSDRQPEPNWASRYILGDETAFGSKIDALKRRIDKTKHELAKKENELRELNSIKGLLYGTSKFLEAQVTRALQELGYFVKSFSGEYVEIDHVVDDPDENIRFICETEGRDRKAVGIDKFRQLQDHLSQYAGGTKSKRALQGLLFVNGRRLIDPTSRGEVITPALLNRSIQTQTTIVPTVELYKAVSYLMGKKDEEYKKAVRLAIRSKMGGIAEIPDP